MSGDHNMYASGSGNGQRSGWRKRTIMEMAREAGLLPCEGIHPEDLKAFAALVREDERNRTWVGLTDDEVGDLSDFAYANDEEFVRNVEKYLKEKNNG